MGLTYKFALVQMNVRDKSLAGAGALLLTEEALESPLRSNLLDVLEAQPPWSELPLVILTSGGESRRARLLDLAAAAAGTVTLLERPISTRDARPVDAGCITFSPTPIPDARSRHPTQELERNARTPRRRTHSQGCRTGTETPPPLGRIVACRGSGASAHSGDAA